VERGVRQQRIRRVYAIALLAHLNDQVQVIARDFSLPTPTGPASESQSAERREAARSASGARNTDKPARCRYVGTLDSGLSWK
jgi:hypothetical protein